MGVYVKGMEMPESCGECKMHFLSFDSNVCCQITDRIPKIVARFHDSKIDLDARKKSIMSVKRPEWCPLVDVPKPHGRLIDADATMKQWGLDKATKYGNKTAEQQHFSYSSMMMYEVVDILDDAPIVIDAEDK